MVPRSRRDVEREKRVVGDRLGSAEDDLEGRAVQLQDAPGDLGRVDAGLDLAFATTCGAAVLAVVSAVYLPAPLLTLIREARRLKADLPVIIITGFSTESSAIEAVNLGVTGYLTKPFRVPQVLATVARTFGEA